MTTKMNFKMMKKITIMILLLSLIFTLCACGKETNETDKAKENCNEDYINWEIENPENLENGNYIVLNVREHALKGQYYQKFYVILTLQDNNERFYYQYCSENETKDDYYISLAKLISGDIVICQDMKLRISE